MGWIKTISKVAFSELAKDILSQSVKRFGAYRIGIYCVSVVNGDSLGGSERVQRYYQNHLDKYQSNLAQRRKSYQFRKANRLCVKCGRPAQVVCGEVRVLCSKCHKRELERVAKR